MKKLIFTIIGIAVVGVGYWLISPLFIDKQVDEALPETIEIEDINVEKIVTIDDEKQINVQKLNLDAQLSLEDMPTFNAEMEKMSDVKIEENMPEQGIESSNTNRSGIFVDVAHHGSGDVKIIPVSEGESLIRIENLDVSNGPDLRVLLSKNSNVRSSDDLGEYVELGKLKGNIGNQNYGIPKDIDVAEYNSVVIYCQPFHVVFNSAELK